MHVQTKRILQRYCRFHIGETCSVYTVSTSIVAQLLYSYFYCMSYSVKWCSCYFSPSDYGEKNSTFFILFLFLFLAHIILKCRSLPCQQDIVYFYGLLQYLSYIAILTTTRHQPYALQFSQDPSPIQILTTLHCRQTTLCVQVLTVHLNFGANTFLYYFSYY